MAIQCVGDTSASLHDASTRSCRFVRFGSNMALVRAWIRLDQQAILPTQSHSFAAALSETLLTDSHMAVLLTPSVEGANALLPLCRNSGFFARWRSMGSLEVFEPIDALYADAAAADALARSLARQRRPVRLDRLPSQSAMVPALKKAMRGRGYVSVRSAVPTPTIELCERWKAPDACFNARRRSDFRRAARKAQEIGSVTYEVQSPEPDSFDRLFDEAVGVELRSWKNAAGSAIGVDPGKEKFFRTFFRSASEEGTFRLAFLRIDGQAVAMQMALERLDRYWLFKIGYNEEFGRCSPGTLLMLHTLAWAAKRELRSYELLGDVEPWITDLWTRESHGCARLRTYPFGLRGGVAFLADSLEWARSRLQARFR